VRALRSNLWWISWSILVVAQVDGLMGVVACNTCGICGSKGDILAPFYNLPSFPAPLAIILGDKYTTTTNQQDINQAWEVMP